MKIKYIAELLHRYECVIVPGLGGFLTSYLPAHIDRESHWFSPPSCKVAFNEGLSGNDGLLANYIATSEAISYKEALDDLRAWVEVSLKALQSGERLVIDEIGALWLNPEGNLQFEPGDHTNFHSDSFALPSFIARPVKRQDIRIPAEIQKAKQGISGSRRLITESLKWAAVLAPFIAFSVWGSMNTGKIGQYLHNYSGLYSWVRTTPGKTAIQPANTVIAESMPAPASDSPITPSGIFSAVSPGISPATIAYESLREILPADERIKATETETDEQNTFFIIGGVFREPGNALKMLADLKSGGYPAQIIDTTSKGLFVVSIEGFAIRSEALRKLPALREAGYTGAWIMRKG